jgi:phosphatidylglycerol:prolipoprotein diacylglycerol transferase
MKPILYRLADGSYIHSGHFMLFVGGLAAIVLLALDMRRTGERPEEIYPLLLLLLVSTIFGARLLYCIDFHDQHGYSLRDVLEFWKGGMALHGGAILAFVAYALYTSWRRLDFWGTGDLLTPPAAMFIFFARIGCFLTGCCYGKQCDPDFPLALTFTNHSAIAPKNEFLYPTQLAFAAAALLVFVVVWVRRRHERFEGEISLVGVSLFSLTSFVIEFFRGDLRVLYDIGGIHLSQNQIIGAGIFLAAVSLYLHRRAA